MRLLEAMRVGKHVLPKNSLLIGEGRIQGERLHVNILQVEYGGTSSPVKLAVYDNDGQEGIFIPGSMEANAVKEVAIIGGRRTLYAQRLALFSYTDKEPVQRAL